MRITFRVDASVEIGMGHLMRCLALAQWLDDTHIECIFVVRSTSIPFCRARHDWLGKIIIIPDDISLEEEVHWIKQHELIHQSDALILDGYHFNEVYRKKIRESFHTVVTFDDLQIEGCLHADVVINGADGVTERDYENRAPSAMLCLGRRYRVFRKEFAVISDIHWNKRHSLLISMGGTDPMNVTLPLLTQVSQMDNGIPIRVLCGSGYQQTSQLQETITQIENPVQLIQNCQEVAEILSHTRLAVVAAGSTQFEVLHCATPSVLIELAENQRLATTAAAKQGWCKTYEYEGNEQLDSLAKQVVSLFRNDTELQHMHEAAIDIRQPDSSINTVEAIFQKMSNHQ